jgi:tRNA1Val (adenine37-N6)-methyltransferase
MNTVTAKKKAREEMPNDYFQFKQFTIWQDRCAMKVSTEACILGAWFARQDIKCETILDIGSGTGLLMLMLAQKWPGQFHGIEIDTVATEQLKENIRQSPWKEACTLFGGDIRTYSLPVVYDFIITNPPFYEKQLASPNSSVNLARHSSTLTLEELLQAIEVNLSSTGSFGIILPTDRAIHFEKLAKENQFYLLQKLHIRHSAVHGEFRIILHMGRNEGKQTSSALFIIRDDAGNYTDGFIEIMQDYYLNL